MFPRSGFDQRQSLFGMRGITQVSTSAVSSAPMNRMLFDESQPRSKTTTFAGSAPAGATWWLIQALVRGGAQLQSQDLADVGLRESSRNSMYFGRL